MKLKTRFLILFLIFLSFELRAQSETQTLFGDFDHLGGFAGLGFKISNFRDRTIGIMDLKGGIDLNHTLRLGLELNGVFPTARFEDVTPNYSVIMNSFYGGGFISAVLHSDRIIHVTIPITAGAGWIGFLRDWEDDTVQDLSHINSGDYFLFVEPGLLGEINLTTHIRLNFGYSYRLTQKIDLKNTAPDAFQGGNFNFGLLVGGF